MTEAEQEYEAGGEHDSSGRADEAIPRYERALELGLPEELVPRALLQLGSSLRNVGRIDEAIALFDDAVSRFPADAALRLFRAFALSTAGRDRDALVDVLDLARARIDAPEIDRYARSLESYTRELGEDRPRPDEAPDLELELVVLPVADVDRAKSFYTERAGFTLDVDHRAGDSFRVVQLTPPGSACSISFGVGITDASPGSVRGLHLMVTDIVAARESLRERGLEVGEIRHMDAGAWSSGPHPERGDYSSFAGFADPDGNTWVVQERGHSASSA